MNDVKALNTIKKRGRHMTASFLLFGCILISEIFLSVVKIWKQHTKHCSEPGCGFGYKQRIGTYIVYQHLGHKHTCDKFRNTRKHRPACNAHLLMNVAEYMQDMKHNKAKRHNGQVSHRN